MLTLTSIVLYEFANPFALQNSLAEFEEEEQKEKGKERIFHVSYTLFFSYNVRSRVDKDIVHVMASITFPRFLKFHRIGSTSMRHPRRKSDLESL
jgi:hypothetical protein